jgi:pimeloyl-ACP methyl ester carboxylesterase
MPQRTDETDSAGVAVSLAETEVSFPSMKDGTMLAGTLAIPSGGPAVAAAVLVSGTGPMDRDVTFIGHALFRVTAHSLARAGIATLRFDKRGVGQSGGDFSSAGPEDFVGDVLGARECLIRQEGIAADRVGLIGHSEGGMVTLTASAESPRVAFAVVLAGPLLSGRDNLARSFALLARGELKRDSVFDEHVSEMTTLFEIARTSEQPERNPRASEIASRLAPLIVNEKTEVMFGRRNISGEEFLSFLTSRCLETCVSWEPTSIVPRVECPVLFVYAAKDLQVPAHENAAAARTLIDRLDRKDWTIREIADVNHVFQRCGTGMPDEYASIDHVMAGDVLDEIAAWVKRSSRWTGCP